MWWRSINHEQLSAVRLVFHDAMGFSIHGVLALVIFEIDNLLCIAVI